MGALLDLIRVLYEPAAVFERVRERPRFLIPVFALIVLSLGIGFLAMPYVKAAIGAVMAQRAPAGAQSPMNAGTAALVQVVASAIFVPIFLVLSAGVLWIAVSLFGEDAKYRLLLSVVTYTSVFYILQLLAGFAVLSLRGVARVTSPADLQPAFGLDLLAPGMSGYLGAVLKGINVFSVAGVLYNGIGIATTHRTSKQTGYTAAAVAFVVTVLVVSLFALLQPKAPA